MTPGQLMVMDQLSAGGSLPDRMRPAGPGRPARAGGRSVGQALGPAGSQTGALEPPAGGGLVPYAISVRDQDEHTALNVSELWRSQFPSPELVAEAADLLPSVSDPAGPSVELREGPRWEIVVSPGVVRVRTRDYARAERTYERAMHRHQVDVDVRVGMLANGEEPSDPMTTRGTIYAWSAKSRARLVARLSDLDYTRLYGRYRVCLECSAEHSELLDHCPSCRSPRSRVVDRTRRLPAMVTLTYPGDWLTVAPDAQTVKGHLRALCKRYARTWGEELIGPWKPEFQRRGAPHFHISTAPPMHFTTITDPVTGERREADFRTWLSLTWADVVNHPDPEERRKHRLAGTGVDYAEGTRLTDPRRMAIYFAKYGTAGGKEYQHKVPAEWCTGVLACDDCGAEYSTDRDACPDCGGLDAELVEGANGPGRFWGYRGLRPVLAVRQVLPETGIHAGRLLRRWYRSKGLTKQVTVERVEQSTGRICTRRSRLRKRLFAHNRGFATVNDGPAFASQLARYLASVASDPPTPRTHSTNPSSSASSANTTGSPSRV